jgi:hypothetical protein
MRKNVKPKQSFHTSMIHRLVAVAVCLSATSSQVLTTFAQGSLTPPGGPAPTMKSLAQIEPRTPIASAPFTISAPGSYYLTTNLAITSGNAVTINASHVTLDLNGFTISSSDTGADPSGTGILLINSNTIPGQIGLRDIRIYNGNIAGSYTNNSGVWQGAGFGSGINFSGSVSPLNIGVRDVSVSGCFNYGILIGLSSTVVESCTVQSVGTYGIYASTISRSTVTFSGNHAIIGQTISECSGNALGAGAGIYATTVNHCYGVSQSGEGIYAQGSATGCYGQSATGAGLHSDGAATGCYGISTGGGYGMIAVAAENCYGESDGTGQGLYTSGNAMNCRARTQGPGDAISATCANNCIGISHSGYGINATIAIGCWGSSETTTNNLRAFIGNSSYGNSGQESVTYKYNMP